MPKDNQPVVRAAATLILVRDGEGGPEVLMVRRSTKASFIAGAYVFPGGALSPDDSNIVWQGADDADEASRELAALKVCAVRECFEEAGLLLAHDASGDLLAMEDAETASAFALLRRKLTDGELMLDELCKAQGLRLAIDGMAWLSRWITPYGAPKRFDTRVFVAPAPPRQTPSPDDGEVIDHVWVRPVDALARQERGEIEMVFATCSILKGLAGFETAAAMLEHAHTPRVVVPVQPRLAAYRGGVRVLGPLDGAYAEVGKLDPFGQAMVSSEIVPGVPVQLSDRVRRITAPNASYMTGPGTNTYLVGSGQDIAVIDPGPANEAHVRTLMEQAGGNIRWILVTHTHPDHSPAAALLKRMTGAEVLGVPPGKTDYDDAGFRPDRLLAHGERLGIAGCTLRVIHTPGHASNHLCYLLEEERLLFTGDHVMQGSTVVINPPDGDMAAYMASLRALLDEDVAYFAPGHGFLMDHTPQVVEWLLAHRQERENSICAVLQEMGEATIEELLPRVYADVPVQVHPLAARSLLAHLGKLVTENRAEADRGRWWLR